MYKNNCENKIKNCLIYMTKFFILMETHKKWGPSFYKNNSIFISIIETIFDFAKYKKLINYNNVKEMIFDHYCNGNINPPIFKTYDDLWKIIAK